MDQFIDPATGQQIKDLLLSLRAFGVSLFEPWRLYQVGILLACFGFGHLASRLLTGRMNDWMRQLEGWPKWRLRALVLINQRIRSTAFVLALWLCYQVLQLVTWPSHSYLIGVAAELSTAWLVVSIVSRFIRNRTLRRSVRWFAWAFVTLNLLGLTPLATDLLDGIGLSVGNFRISLLIVLKALVVLVILLASARAITRAIAQRVEGNEDLSPSMKVLSVKLVQPLVYGVAIFIGLQSVGFDLTSLTVLSGAIGLGIGFGLQKVVSNLVSGVILLLDKSIKPGDVISLGDTFGWINSLGARYVSVLTRDGREYLIPNEDLITNQVVNWSYSSELVRLDIPFGVSYASDPRAVKRIASAAPLQVDRVISDPAPVCHVTGFGDSSIDFLLRFWIRDPTKGLTNVRGDVFLALWDALKDNGIEIPYPRRDISFVGAPSAVIVPRGAE